MKLRGLLTLAFVANGLMASAQAGVPVTIELLPQVTVRGQQVRLAQVAYVTTTDLPTLRRLLALPLGHAPLAGETVKLDRETLARWLRSRAGLASSQTAWAGASSSALTSGSHQLGGMEVVQAAEHALRAWLASRDELAQLDVVAVPQEIQLPQGELSLRARSLDDSQPRSRMLVWIDVWVDDRFVRALPVSFEVSQAAPTISKGEWVTARSVNGSIVLESRAQALQDGRLGQLVRIKPANVGNIIAARVTAQGQVEVRE